MYQTHKLGPRFPCLFPSHFWPKSVDIHQHLSIHTLISPHLCVKDIVQMDEQHHLKPLTERVRTRAVVRAPPGGISAGDGPSVYNPAGSFWQKSRGLGPMSAMGQHLSSGTMARSSPVAQSPSTAAVKRPSPHASSSRTMSAAAVLELPPSIFPHLPSGPRPLKLPLVEIWKTNVRLDGQVFWSRSAKEASFAQTPLHHPVHWPRKDDVKQFWKPWQLSELLHLESKVTTASLPLCLDYTDSMDYGTLTHCKPLGTIVINNNSASPCSFSLSSEMFCVLLKTPSQMTTWATQPSLAKKKSCNCQEKRSEKLKNITLKSRIVKMQAGTSDQLAVDVPQFEGSLFYISLSAWLSWH